MNIGIPLSNPNESYITESELVPRGKGEKTLWKGSSLEFENEYWFSFGAIFCDNVPFA